MIQKLDEIGSQALEQIQSAAGLPDLEQIRVSVLGKKGSLSDVLKGLKDVSGEERPRIGAAANQWKTKIDGAISAKREALEADALQAKISHERIDVSIPSRLPHRGGVNPLTQTVRKLVRVFQRMGFDVTAGPEIETEFLNFEAVNIPQDHPARDMQDTFFAGPGVVLRTHTSPVQMRTMKDHEWPIRILCPGAVYRCDNDATHSPMFHQIEGLWIDRDVKMSHLRGTLEVFAKEMFGQDTAIRLRPSYFPFTEPSAEVDVSCPFCQKGQSCSVCKDTGWIEILGSGMVHPSLFEEAGYDSSKVSGFAFGIGIERIAMMLHRIPDLRLFFQGDVRFLSQF